MNSNEFGVSRCKLLYRERINNEVLLYSTGSYSQYPVINHDGKEYETECIHMYNWITLLYCRNQHNIVNQLYFNKINFKIGEFNTFIYTHTHTHARPSNWNHFKKRISREERNASFVFISSQGDNYPTEMKKSDPSHWKAASVYEPKIYGWVYQPHSWRITERAGTPSGKVSSMT